MTIKHQLSDSVQYMRQLERTRGRGTLSKELGCDTAARVNQDDNGEVKITSLSQAIDRFDDKFVDLLKLDCEGYEHQLMEAKGPWSNCKYLAMEYHLGPEMKPESICSNIQDLGFEILSKSSRNPVIGNILAKEKIETLSLRTMSKWQKLKNRIRLATAYRWFLSLEMILLASG